MSPLHNVLISFVLTIIRYKGYN